MKLKNIQINACNIAHKENEERSQKIISENAEETVDKIQHCYIKTTTTTLDKRLEQF